MTREIKLTQGKVAIVDDEDFEFLNRWKWSCGSGGYALRNSPRSDGSHRHVLMHRLIALPHYGEHTDHINQDKLDNRSSNLRVCTNSQNGMNKGKQSNNTSGYKGVYKHEIGRWAARINAGGKKISLGLYKDVLDAAKAYDKAALKYHGEFAYLNIPNKEIIDEQ